VRHQPEAHLLRRVEIFQVMQPRAQPGSRHAIAEDAKAKERLGGNAPREQTATNVPSRGQDERVGPKRPVARPGRRDLSARTLERCDLSGHGTQRDGLLEAPSMRRWRRSQELETVRREMCEAR